MKPSFDSSLRASKVIPALAACGLVLLVLGFAIQAIRGNTAAHEATAVLQIPVAEDPTAASSPRTLLLGAPTEAQALRQALGRDYNVQAIPVDDTWGIEVRAQRGSEAEAITAVRRADLVDFRTEGITARAATRTEAIDAERAALVQEQQELQAALGADASLSLGPIPSYVFSFVDGESYVDQRRATDPDFSPIETAHHLLRLDRIATSLDDLDREAEALANLEPFLTSELSEVETSRVLRSGFAIRDVMKVLGTLMLLTAAVGAAGRQWKARSPRTFRQARAIGGASLGLWIIMVLVTLVQARAGVNRATEGLKPLEDSRNAADLITDIDATRKSLVDASTELDNVDRKLDAPWMWPVHAIPGLQIPWDASRDMLAATKKATDTTVGFLDETKAAVDDLSATPRDRIRALARIATASRQSRVELARIRVPARPSLPAPLRGQHNRLERNLTSATTQLAELADAMDLLRELLSTDGEWLLLGGNNAENRLSMGSLDQLGTITISGGDIEVGEIRGDTSPRTLWNVPNQVRNLEAGEVESYDEDLARNFGAIPMEQFWDSLGMTPRFDASAELASQMWTAVTDTTPRGVIYVDSIALSEITRALGGITVNGRDFDSEDVRQELVVGQYQSGLDRGDRYELSQQLTEVVMEDVQQADDVTRLAGGMLNAVSNRHLMFWSPDPEAAAQANRLDLSGGTSATSHGVSIASLSGRWDNFLDVQIITGTECVNDRLEATTTIILTFAGTDELAENFGFEHVWGEPAGTFIGLLGVTLPAGAVVTTSDLGPFDLGVQRDGAAQMASAFVRLDAGDRSTIELSWTSPELRRIDVLPDGRSRPSNWTVTSSASDPVSRPGGFTIRTC